MKTIIYVMTCLLLAGLVSATIDYRSQSYNSFEPVGIGDNVLSVGEKCVYSVQPWGYTVYGVGSRYSDGSIKCAIPGSSKKDRVKKVVEEVVSAPSNPVIVPEPVIPEPTCTPSFKSKTVCTELSIKHPQIQLYWRCSQYQTYTINLCDNPNPSFYCGDWDEPEFGVNTRVCGWY